MEKQSAGFRALLQRLTVQKQGSCFCVGDHPSYQARGQRGSSPLLRFLANWFSFRQSTSANIQTANELYHFLDREIFSPAKNGAVTGDTTEVLWDFECKQTLLLLEEGHTSLLGWCGSNGILPPQLQLFIWEELRQARPREQLLFPGTLLPLSAVCSREAGH